MNKHPRIAINPDIMFGKPVIKGTRITVEQILSKLGAGLTPGQVIEEHPHLTIDDIHAAQQFAADYLADEEIFFA
jgi:uncharacterized protein (DUF433 family)